MPFDTPTYYTEAGDSGAFTLAEEVFVQQLASYASYVASNVLMVAAIGTTVQAYSLNLTSWAAKTVPAGTVVGTTDVQNITNKTLDNTNTVVLKGTKFTLQDDTDITKQAQFLLSGITTGTTRVYTLPNLASAVLATIGNLAQTFAGNTVFSNATVTVGSSTASANYGLGTGATISAATKNINIGTNGVSGSTTNIILGSSVSGAASTITLNGSVVMTGALTGATINASSNAISNLTTAMFAANVVDTDITLAANSATRLPSQSAVKSYVDNLLTGLQWKTAVRVATTTNGVLATAYENGDTIDGVVLATGDRILLKNQTAQSENGIYVVAASGAPTRATDSDTGAELVSATVFVREGTTNSDTQWTCTNDAITLGSTNIVFAQVSGAGTYSAGTGLTLTGNQFIIDTAIVPRKTDNLSVFAATTSAQLASIISDETGSGTLVFGTSPTLITPILGVATATSINGLTISTTNGTLTLDTGAILRVISGGNLTLAGFTLTLSGNASVSGTNTGDQNLTNYLQDSTGRAANTILIGGTAAGGTLELRSTSNPTKGKILFGTSAYDEVNNRLGIKVTTPLFALHVRDSSGVIALFESAAFQGGYIGSPGVFSVPGDEIGFFDAGSDSAIFAYVISTADIYFGQPGSGMKIDAGGSLTIDGTSLTLATVAVPTISSTHTFTNKRITPRAAQIASNATPTFNTDSLDLLSITALAVAITSMTTNMSGTPTNGQKLSIRIKDNGTSRAITWGTKFLAKGATLLTATVAGKLWTGTFEYDTVTAAWGLLTASQET